MEPIKNYVPVVYKNRENSYSNCKNPFLQLLRTFLNAAGTYVDMFHSKRCFFKCNPSKISNFEKNVFEILHPY